MSSDSGETTVVRTIGRYRVSGELGRGAMGVVYKGFDPLIGRTVALKTLSIDNTDAQAREFRERLYREAAAAGALSHPNIVTIFDIIEAGGLTAIAMEFIEGRPLSAIVTERAPLPIDLAVEILDQICAALDYAGSQGIVHRDIKPANILVTSAGRAKVTDFGVARLALSTMTQAGTVLGSPSYMSPEQVKGLSLDGRSDLFSAAVVFFEMITRERPFAGNDIATTMYRIAHEAPTPPTHFNPEIGPGVATLLDRAFAKNPADRFQTGADLVAGLRAAASLGSARGSSLALAALATAPPAVPPIVAPMVTLQATSAAAPEVAPANAAPIPVTRSAAPSSSGSQGLAPIPEAVSSAGPAAGPVGSGVDLPVIPLPPEPAAVPASIAAAPAKPQARAKPSARSAGGSHRGLLVGAIAVLVVGVGIAGALYVRGGAGGAIEGPAASVAEPPSQPMPEPAGAVAIPEAPPAGAPPTAPPAGGTAAGRGSTGPTARVSGAPQSTPGKKPLATQPTPAMQGFGAAVVPARAAPAAPPSPAPAPGRVYQSNEVDSKPAVLTQVAPEYPAEAARQRSPDVVVLQVLVDESGRPQTIKVLRGARTSGLLDGAAEAAVRQWTFRPATKGGQPVACWFNLAVPFPPAK